MNSLTCSQIQILLHFLSLYFTLPAFAANSNVTHILLSCGTTGNIPDPDNNRTWVGDIGTKYLSKQPSQISVIEHQNPAVPSVPFSNARIFTTDYTYSFPLSPGRYFLRLYFYPTNYSNHITSDSFFTATAGPCTLLSNFSALMTVNAMNYAYLIREYSINHTSDALNLTFAPSTKHPNAYAFVNGIEIISSPDLFTTSTTYYADRLGLGLNIPFTIDPGMAFQTMYRLNVGGQALSPSQDSGNLYRSWDDDSVYIFGAAFGVTFQNDPNVTIQYPKIVPQYIAPVSVYETARSMGPNPQINLQYNLTWILSIDAGFYYLVRFHFCEIQYPITKVNQRVFFIYINNQTAQSQFDVIAYSGGLGVPTYMDYVYITSGPGQMDMWVALHPDLSTKSEYFDAILNGLEVFKMSAAENTLAGVNPVPETQKPINPTQSDGMNNGSKQKVAKIVGLAIGVPCGVILVSFSVCIFLLAPCKCHKNKEKDSNASLPANNYRHFSFTEILAATKGFDEARVLGVGGFGKVYLGEIDNGSTNVAIKRASQMSDQGFHEFQTEIDLLSKLHHKHLVSLIGYCQEKDEKILVYEYMAKGTLRQHLYKFPSAPLTWNQRLEICIGAARGLHYLHRGAKHAIIHHDVKTTNILLDENLVAKMSDFGLSKTGLALDETHVTTIVKGSFGYIDPEYYMLQQLTEKSDMYSFGVVLFEVLCARPVIINHLPEEQVNLADWAQFCLSNGMLEEIIDPYLQGKIAPQCFKKFAETAKNCLAERSINRPTIEDVLWNLEFALQLQASADESGSLVLGGTTSAVGSSIDLHGRKELTDEPTTDETTTTTTTISMGERSTASGSSDRLTPSAIFSQIMNPVGR